MEGWINIHRKLMDHWIWDNPDYLKAWLTILLTVNHQDKKVVIEGELIECNRGQSVMSLNNWVKAFGKGWSVQKVRTLLNLLKNDEMITTEGLRKTTRLTVCKYDNYQFKQQADNKQTTRRQQGDNKEITTNNNDNNDKNKNIPPNFELLKAYCEGRKNNIDPQKFFDYYQARGWAMNGGKKMKDWQAAVRTWEKNDKKFNNEPVKVIPEFNPGPGR
jgi:hypothetical protein